jgi:arabinogalactan endo-1,4-beta-galactosidase
MKRTGAILTTAALLLAASALVPSAAAGASSITNPGFESSSASQTPANWTEAGTVAASYSEAGGRSGNYRLSHWSASAYTVETTQTLTGLAATSYTLKVWVRSGGGQTSASIGLKNCGATNQLSSIPTTPGTAWFQMSVTTTVSGGNCTISLYSSAPAGSWINFDDLTFAAGAGSAISIRGGDVSALKKNEDHGGLYYSAGGTQGDALAILKNAGMNYGRLKVWVNPADGYNNKARVLTMAARIKARGMKLLVDFHYSDAWADPGKQNKPAAWAGYNATQLRTAVYNHTYDVLNALKAQGTTADMVQIGNELNGGMLWPDGQSTTANWGNLAALLNSGINAAKAVSSSTKIMLHLAEGGNNTLFRWWFDQAVAYSVPFDVIGASYYGYWHGSLAGLQTNLNDMAARYGKPVVVVETAYGFTTAQDDTFTNIFTASHASTAGYDATPLGQAQNLRAVFEVVKAVPNGRGMGVFYWEPSWTAVAGSGWDPANPAAGNEWENQALFDYNSRALPGMLVLGQA